MESIKVAVTVPLAAAVAAGRASYGDTTVALSDAEIARLSPEGRGILYAKDGIVRVAKWHPNFNDGAWQRDGAPLEIEAADIEHVIAAIEAIASSRVEWAAKRAAEAEERREKRVQEALAEPIAKWISFDRRTPCYCDENGYAHHRPYLDRLDARYVGQVCVDGIGTDPRVIAKYRGVEAVMPSLVSEYESKLAFDAAKKEVEKEAEQRRQSAIRAEHRALVAARGTANQLDRFDAGVLPQDELIALARADWLPQIDRPIYVPMVKGDVSHDDADDLDEIAEHVQRVKFSAEECVGPWTAEQWQTIKAIEAEHRIYLDGAPEAVGMTITPMIHKAWCSVNDCNGHAERYGVRVRVEHYGLRAQIEYALPGDG